ncbi:MAG: putative spheroidene monooxygenase [Frankiales bacterium]|nr:putative spheroidene monooxygenase [Frankiales bacterium]
MDPAVVTLHVWRVPLARVPQVLRDTRRRQPGMLFSKALGTGRGFLPHQADLTRWARLSTWSKRPDDLPLGYATECWRVDLRPLRSRGQWSRQDPFGDPSGEHPGTTAVLTRARLRPSRAARFWSAVPDVTRSLDGAPGVRVSLAVGEAPIGLQGTFSVWDSPEQLRAFAHAGAHKDVIARTPEEKWYAEELFARFAVEASTGTLDGRDPLA